MSHVSYFARETLISLRRNLMMTVAGIATVAVSLALFGGIMLLSRWVDHGTERLKGGVTLEIFMNVRATDPQIQAVKDALVHDHNVKHFRFLTKQDAYREFKRIFSRETAITESIRPADLPASFRVAPRKAELTPNLQRQYTTVQGVDEVTTPGEALKGLLDVTRTIRYIFVGISLILLASSLFLIVNTIRLATFARRREIEVMKLVGASNWFVRVPFIAEAVVQGMVGAGLACLCILALKSFGFDSAFEDRKSFFSEFYVTSADTIKVAILMLAIGFGIGIVGATIGMRRFLRD